VRRAAAMAFLLSIGCACLWLPSAGATPTTPGAPRITRIVTSSGGVTIAWSAPASNGGSPITGYDVEPIGDVAASARSAIGQGLEDGATYDATVRAENAQGFGPPSPVVKFTPRPNGYWMLTRDGTVYAFGEVKVQPGVGFRGDTYVHIEPSINGHDYWTITAQGDVEAFEDFSFIGTDEITTFGSPRRALLPNEQVVSLSKVNATLTSCLAAIGGCPGHQHHESYWVFTNRGRVLPYGLAPQYGDLSRKALNGPIVASVSTPSGKGYYMVASDGGVFGFGDARFYGSMGAKHLNQPINGLVPTADGRGYWLVASDGGIFAFGDATFRGSMGGHPINQPIVGMVRFGNGYLMIAADGGVFDFSNQRFDGALPPLVPSAPIVSIAASG
jgi:hypothetical protein